MVVIMIFNMTTLENVVNVQMYVQYEHNVSLLFVQPVDVFRDG